MTLDASNPQSGDIPGITTRHNIDVVLIENKCDLEDQTCKESQYGSCFADQPSGW